MVCFYHYNLTAQKILCFCEAEFLLIQHIYGTAVRWQMIACLNKIQELHFRAAAKDYQSMF